MAERLSRAEALQVLALRPSADREEIKRAYRTLARQHHPDRGGDPRTFAEVTSAFERLLTDATPPPTPRVARGRPSRSPFAQPAPSGDITSVDWSTCCPEPGQRLDRDALAIALARGPHVPVTPVTATSRAPGSRLNGLAPHLAEHATARLAVGPGEDDRGRLVVAVQVRAWSRRGRRALDQADLLGCWARVRGSSSTLLRSLLPPSNEVRTTAVAASDRAAELLGSLGWELPAWTLTDHVST